jgi:AcrR family transcriptional regulator
MAFTTDRRRRNTRREVVGRAVEVARAEGLERLTIGRLATEMEMSKSGLFRHFGSKEDLQLATLDAAATEYVEQIVRPALEAPEGIARLRLLCAGYFDYLEGRQAAGGCFWAATSAEFDDRPGRISDRVREFVAAWVALLAAEARNAGAPDPDQLAFELHALALGANLRAQLLRDEAAYVRARAGMERLLAPLERAGDQPQ